MMSMNAFNYAYIYIEVLIEWIFSTHKLVVEQGLFQCDVVNNASGYHYITLWCNSLSNIDKN